MTRDERITQALQWLDGHREANPDEFRRAMGQGGDMLLTACESAGYVARAGEALELTVPGFRRLHALSVEVTS